jgi:hypothetical protein
MSLKKHAQHELELAGLFDKDSDYGGMIGKAVMELIEVFAKQGHSGFSAHWVLGTFKTVASFKTLTPINADNPDEWMDVSEMSGKPMWQNKRDSEIFSEDGGKTFYNVNDKK